MPMIWSSSRAIRRTRRNKGRWTNEEHEGFLRGLDVHGRDWDAVKLLVPTRTALQVRTHAQKYFAKTSKGRLFPEQPYLTNAAVARNPTSYWPKTFSVGATTPSPSCCKPRSPSPAVSCLSRGVVRPPPVLASSPRASAAAAAAAETGDTSSADPASGERRQQQQQQRQRQQQNQQHQQRKQQQQQQHQQQYHQHHQQQQQQQAMGVTTDAANNSSTGVLQGMRQCRQGPGDGSGSSSGTSCSGGGSGGDNGSVSGEKRCRSPEFRPVFRDAICQDTIARVSPVGLPGAAVGFGMHPSGSRAGGAPSNPHSLGSSSPSPSLESTSFNSWPTPHATVQSGSDPATVGHDSAPPPTAWASGVALGGRYSLVASSFTPSHRLVASPCLGNLTSSVPSSLRVAAAECRGGMCGGGSGGSGSGSGSGSDGGGDGGRDGGGSNHRYRYDRFAATSTCPGSLPSSFREEHGGVPGGGGGGGGGSSSSGSGSDSDSGGGSGRDGDGDNSGNRHDWSVAASPCLDSFPSSFMEGAEWHSVVPGGGGASCSGSGSGSTSSSASRIAGGSGGTCGSTDNQCNQTGDAPHSQPCIHRLHNPKTFDLNHAATHSPGAVALSATQGASAWSLSKPGENEHEEQEVEEEKGEVEEEVEEDQEQGGGYGYASMLPDPRELKGGMYPPEGWLRYPLPAAEDGDDASDEMVYRFLAEDHFGML